MGHSSINVTLDRYGHLFPELDEAIAASFGEGFATARVAARVERRARGVRGPELKRYTQRRTSGCRREPCLS